MPTFGTLPLAHPSLNTTTPAWATTYDRGLLTILSLAPLFVVTIRSWSSALLILGSLFSLLSLIHPSARRQHDTATPGPIKNWVILIFLLPVIAIGISSTLRSDHVLSNYDSSARFLIAIPILLLAIRTRLNFAKLLQYTAPVSLILTLLHQVFIPQPMLWGSGRMSTYFSDPLVFGYISLTLGLLSGISINLIKQDSKALVALKLIGLVIGIYLSIKSGSRTGWLAIPIIGMLWIHQKNALHKTKLNPWFIGIGMLVLSGLVYLSPTVHQRLALAFTEVLTYNWTGIAPETSVGLRITFLRIAADLFAANPLHGFGDTRDQLSNIPQKIYNYASPESIRVALTSGFHNEVVTNAIRSGLAGLVSSTLLFVVPLAIFVRQLKSLVQTQRANAMLGLVFSLCVLISSFSTEVFDLKYTASFYALMMALFIASAITNKPEN